MTPFINIHRQHVPEKQTERETQKKPFNFFFSVISDKSIRIIDARRKMFVSFDEGDENSRHLNKSKMQTAKFLSILTNTGNPEGEEREKDSGWLILTNIVGM